ncbi:formate/nitrite transporter family protein [Corynebacterium sp. TA-R-1]|uniref:Formate/nitrite transporter family protein n=1 Tax=Corynebacterium stercoris TaxID=2943490 RepID=A0ABT1G1Z7_9CORY|nr:formate/nitrite transporter family protein [Corynebacterium stercoris]MCP1387847.1 formate/nitrite transporter family protein [Corynebacterium stercoris]
MSLAETLDKAAAKKVDLLENDFGRFAVRAILAGIYLTVATAFAGVAGNAVEQHAKGLGAVVFALLFGFGLFAIVVLNTELATGDMMFGSWASAKGNLSWGKTIWFFIAATIFNLVGAFIVAAILSQSAKLGSMDNTHLIATLSEGKLNKSAWGAFIEAVLANFVVNMAILMGLQAKEVISKFVAIVPIIAIFVGLGLEHIIANFSLMTITMFADPLPDNFTVGAVALNWTMVLIGNFIGGGLGIGAVYAWLNKTQTVYTD